MRILIVEDHAELAETVAGGVRREGMAVDLAFDGDQGLEREAATDYDVIVLDRDLPVVHGDQVCRELVARGSRARVLMLTAASSVEELVDGLSLGADDYLGKPFAFAELTARIRALARRGAPPVTPGLTRGHPAPGPARRGARRGRRHAAPSAHEASALAILRST